MSVMLIVLAALYLVGWVACIKPLAIDSLEARMERVERQAREDAELYPHSQPYRGPFVPSAYGRRQAVWGGAGRAIIWPVTMSVRMLAQGVTTAAEREALAAEQQKAAEAELARVRKLAQKAGLIFPVDEQ